MIKQLSILVLTALLFSCSEKKLNVDVKTHLNIEQQKNLKYDVIRYIQDLPRNATQQNKFDTIFDAPYKKMADSLDILNAYKNLESDTLYFAVAKIAPSLKLKKVATVGKLVYDKNHKIQYYEETFRTWKMEVPELKETTEMLFKKFIQGKDLSEFYTKNSNGKFIIEFPDDNNKYDTKSRQWIFNGNKDLMQN